MKPVYFFVGYWPDYEELFIQQAASNQYDIRVFNPRILWRDRFAKRRCEWWYKLFRSRKEKQLLQTLFQNHQDDVFFIQDSSLILNTLIHYPKHLNAVVLMRNTLQKDSDVGKKVLQTVSAGYPVWSFDENDCKQYGFHLYRQFAAALPEIASVPIKYDLVFVGLDKGRKETLQTIGRLAEEAGLSCLIDIRQKNKGKNGHTAYTDYLRTECSGRCIIDIVKEGQTGITLRPLEAALYGRKLLTNNSSVLELPFYHPDNVLVFGQTNTLTAAELKNFLQRPFHNIEHKKLSMFHIHTLISNLY